MKLTLVILTCIAPLVLTGCATVNATYDKTLPGDLKGKTIVRWVEPDTFIFIPDRSDPLTFTRHNGEVITPGRMLTDGGSIPRPLWILRNYSPWGYAPAFIVHDWLFEMKQCDMDGNELYTHQIAADVMAEVMKTMMLSGKVDIDKPTVWSMHTAVSSGISEKLWEEGKCQPPPADLQTKKAIAEYVISFP